MTFSVNRKVEYYVCECAGERKELDISTEGHDFLWSMCLNANLPAASAFLSHHSLVSFTKNT